ncbi:CaiB/BaiF CoA transferase family protein [Sphingomonas nostoxanthinifaciens]|uniref:CaiB/BaiF CoA transferase family protein n=1 Tax=Sphingomonas nostoxanthinifaciens TaxID=2872652 RepID=UPI001CC1FA4B|nr:CoA transferase [Sphingomonas nostoxanthinifaciens]UAK23281.1 CoA transferase [Sphingomonas nostoxanthinifaciens]
MQPLAGLRVLDVSQVMAGPFACMLLGDMGADVIKVEPPVVGDSSRRSMGFRLKGDDSPGFLALNRNKRSIVLDLKDPADRDTFDALAKTADILVENGRPGVADRLGIGYERLRALNPRLIYASISGFGPGGPWAARPGYDLIAQAMSGIMSAVGLPGHEPVKNGTPVADLGSALFAVYGILSAVIGREKTGEGQLVTASLFEAALGLSIWETAEYWGTGQSPKPLGSANRMSAPYQAVAASDGWFVFAAANQKLWLALLQVMSLPELNDDPRFGDNSVRVANAAVLIDTLRPTFATRTVEQWVSGLLAAGVPAGPILDYAQSLASDHAAARQMVQDIPHPVEGSFKALGFPVKLSATPQQLRMPPPLLDQHGAEIKAELEAFVSTDG